MPKYFIGVDIGGTKIKAALVTKTYKVKKSIIFLTEANKGKKVVIKNIINAITEVWDKNVVGIGIGFPAPIELKTGTIKGAINLPGWDNVPLKKIIEKKFKKTVYINNDANCFALAESRLGQGKKHKLVVGLIVGTGLGCGFIIDKQIFTGSTCAAGEVGQIPFKGITLEEYAAGPALKRLSTYQGLTMSPIKIAEMAKRNKGFAKNVFKEYGVNLGVALSVIANTYDPDTIILGGSVSKSFQYFRQTMNQTLKKHVFPMTGRHLKVTKSKLADASVIGAAMLAIDGKSKKKKRTKKK